MTLEAEVSYSVPLTPQSRTDFARLCEDLRSGDIARLNAATDALKTLAPERAQALLLDLWQREEPGRRRWAARHRVLVRIAWWQCFGLPALLLIMLGLSWLLHFSLPWSLFPPLVFLSNISLIPMLLSANYSPNRTQRGAFDLLRRYRLPLLTGLWVDALDFPTGWSGTPYRSSIYAALADLLPRHADLDVSLLDDYRTTLLLREMKRLTRRLRKRRAHLNDTETRFVTATLQHLSLRYEGKADKAVLPLVQQLATLIPGDTDSINRGLVRDVATQCLPVVRAGQH